jgi:hypothetical protein
MFKRSDDVQDGPTLRRTVGFHPLRKQPALFEGQLQFGRYGGNHRRSLAFLQNYVLHEGG